MFLLTVAVLLASWPQAALQIRQREIHEHGAHYRIDVKYPEIEGADRFNAAVRKTVGPTTENFRKGMSGLSAQDTVQVDGYLNGNYKASILKNDIVSVLLNFDEYVPGAAHPGGEMASVNYDSRADTILALSDFFRPGVDYVSPLSRLAIASLDQNEYADHDAIRHGAGPVESNFKVFTLTETALVLHFQTYQVGAGAAGPQTVTLPLVKLETLLRQR